MRKIQIQPLTHDAFAPYGDFADMFRPSGHSLQGELHAFYPDRLLVRADANVGFSPITVKKPEKMVISAAEYHTTTAEVILPLTDDMVLHVAQPSAGTPIPEETKAFLVPMGTMVRLNACVWHLCPLPAAKDSITCMIALPECTYINDCTVVQLPEEDRFELVF